MSTELTPQERAEFWRRKHDQAVTSLLADKARGEFEAFIARINARAEENGMSLVPDAVGEPTFVPRPTEIKKGA